MKNQAGTNIKKRFEDTMKHFEKHEKMNQVSTSDWAYIGMQYGYFDFDPNGDYSAQSELYRKKIEDQKYFLNSGVSLEAYNDFISHCPFDIPETLKNIWLECEGFFSAWGFEEYDADYDRTLNKNLEFSLMPMIGAFGGQRDIERMREDTGSNQLLQWSVLNYELFESCAEYAYKDPSKVDLEKIVKNSIFIEIFSEDLLRYTLCKLDYKEAGCAQMYYSHEDGIYPLKINLDEYIDAMLELKGIVFGWPLLFIEEDNVDSLVLSSKKELLIRAKENDQLLKLEIDFERLGLE